MRILIIFYDSNLNIQEEVDAIVENFDHKILKNSDTKTVLETISNSNWDIIHFPTHGLPHILQINHSETLSGYLLNEILKNKKTFVFANACSSANLISDLQNTDVLTWRAEVKDRVAIDYAVSFYKALVVLKDVEKSAIVASRETSLKHITELPIMVIRGEKTKKKSNKNSGDNIDINVNGNVNTIIGHQHN